MHRSMIFADMMSEFSYINIEQFGVPENCICTLLEKIFQNKINLLS